MTRNIGNIRAHSGPTVKVGPDPSRSSANYKQTVCTVACHAHSSHDEVFSDMPRDVTGCFGRSDSPIDSKGLAAFPCVDTSAFKLDKFNQPCGDVVKRECSVDSQDRVVSACFSRACALASVRVAPSVNSVIRMNDRDVAKLALVTQYKVCFTAYSRDDLRNHLELVPANVSNALVHVKPIGADSSTHRVFVCTTMQHFFNKSNEWCAYAFYADDNKFGSELPFSSANAPLPAKAPESIVGDQVRGGTSNVSGGVIRSRKRVIPAKTTALDGPIAKNYRTSTAVLFNNADELFQDSISREFAQQIIEDLFDTWGIPVDQPDAAKYAEDLLWLFLITVTASNKADYNRAFDVPVKSVERHGDLVTEVEADFAQFSKLLESKYGITRRQFARGVADDLRTYLKLPENQPLLPKLATRIGCEPFLAYLAFDGSTHCTGLTTRETTFTKTLESRNLFERDDVVAQGASDRLMQGMSGGVRAVSSR